MDYQAKNRSQDDVIRMPTDGTAFRDIEDHFKEEPRNLRISLAANGVNPFSQMKFIYVCGLFLLSTTTFLHGCL